MRARVIVGVVAVLAGLAIAFVPGLGPSLPSLLVSLVGLVALLAGVQAVADRFESPDAPDLPQPERRHTAIVPGDEFDEVLSRVSVYGRIGSAYDRDEVRDRLEATTVEVLTRYDGDTPDRARERLAAGTWTDDPWATAFFVPDADLQPSFAERIRFVATSDSTFRQQAKHVIAALDERIAGGR